MPDDLFINIFRFLPRNEMGRSFRVCKQWKSVLGKMDVLGSEYITALLSALILVKAKSGARTIENEDSRNRALLEIVRVEATKDLVSAMVYSFNEFERNFVKIEMFLRVCNILQASKVKLNPKQAEEVGKFLGSYGRFLSKHKKLAEAEMAFRGAETIFMALEKNGMILGDTQRELGYLLMGAKRKEEARVVFNRAEATYRKAADAFGRAF